MKIIVYLRVSRDKQVESGAGLEAQLASCKNYAVSLHHEIHTVYRDEGLSGSLALDKRPALLESIGSLQKGDLLLVAKRDRLGRDPLVVAMIEAAVERKGARIVSCAGEGTENNDPSSILMRRLIDAFSEYESLIIGARTKAALAVKKKNGERMGYIPLGLKLDEDSIHLVEHPEEQALIASIMTMRKNGCKLREIAKYMNEKNNLNRGSPWNHASMHRLIVKHSKHV